MSKFFVYNGIIKRYEEAIFNLSNDDVSLCDGFVETMIAFCPNILQFEQHLIRINKAAKAFMMTEIDIFTNPIQLENIIQYLARKNKLYKTYEIKITIFRDKENKGQNYIIQTNSVNKNKFELNKKGLHINTYNKIILSKSPVSAFQPINSCSKNLAKIYAKQENFDDIIFTDHDENIIETIDSNIFVVYKGKISTPALELGCQRQVMRQTIINKILPKLNIELQETKINSKNLVNADEIFVTNSIDGLKYVIAFKNKRYDNKISTKIIEKLNEEILLTNN